MRMGKSVQLCAIIALPHVPGFTVFVGLCGVDGRERGARPREGCTGACVDIEGLRWALDVEVCDLAAGNPRGQATARRGEASCIASLARRLLKTRWKTRGGEGREGEGEKEGRWR